MKDDTRPSPEALAAAREALREWNTLETKHDSVESFIAVAIDAFAARARAEALREALAAAEDRLQMCAVSPEPGCLCSELVASIRALAGGLPQSPAPSPSGVASRALAPPGGGETGGISIAGGLPGGGK